jgi:hypothetical protein
MWKLETPRLLTQKPLCYHIHLRKEQEQTHKLAATRTGSNNSPHASQIVKSPPTCRHTTQNDAQRQLRQCVIVQVSIKL